MCNLKHTSGLTRKCKQNACSGSSFHRYVQPVKCSLNKIDMLKILQLITALSFFIIIVSCENNSKSNMFKEFIFARIAGVKCDSLNKPYLILETYYEFDSNMTQKLAYSLTNENIKGLDCFCIINENSFDLYDSINKYFCYFNQDSSNELNNYLKAYKKDYKNKHESMGKKKLDYFIVCVKTFDNKEIDFFFKDTTFVINRIINNINSFKSKINCNYNFFKLNSRYKKVEEKLFEAFPPPPPPILKQEAKFVRPE